MQRFRSIDRESDLATPILIQACLPEGHLARYSVEIVESLDRSAIEQSYAGRGHEAYPPRLLLALLIDAYATGIFSSRKIERATYDSIPFRYIAGHLHPDHDPLATFRTQFKQEFEEIFRAGTPNRQGERHESFGQGQSGGYPDSRQCQSP